MNDEVRLLFHELADLDAGEREKIFARRRIGPGLRAEVESLLNFDSSGANALTDCVARAAAEMLRTRALTADLQGRYRVVRPLGSGGMGTVYLAERADDEIEQKVAIKFLRGDGQPAGWRERFLRERQILASLNHPAIVHLIDAGHTEDGRPYLVMEYVDGAPIDLYARGIELRERLKLFLQVCDGVSHAHWHLVIHRDLKPSNILVDAAGQPKILDFGIAKLLEEGRDQTQTLERLLTPGYASPEQMRGAVQTTATDVYSLGAVLGQLLDPQVPADLRSIVSKAMRDEPEERYRSVEAFAADVRAFLESRPVEARSGNAWYRTRKFLLRYRVPVAAAALVLASLGTGIGIANRERVVAQRRFAEVRQLSNKLFDIDAQVRELPGSTRTRQFIVDTALEYLRRLTQEVHGDPALSLEIGNAYMRVARVQGVPISPTLGQMDAAEQNLRIADGFIELVLKTEPANRTALLRSAQIAHDRMIMARFRGQPGEALALARKSARRLDQFDAGSGDRGEASAILNTYLNVADQFTNGQEYEESLRLCRRASDLAGSFHLAAHRGDFLWVEARALRMRGDLDEALQAIRESVRLVDPGPAWITAGGRAKNFQLALVEEGRILGEDNSVSLGRPADAMKTLERAFHMADEFVHRDANDHSSRGCLATAGISLGDILRHSDAAAALEVYRHTLRDLGETPDDVHLRRFGLELLAGAGDAARRLGHLDQARRWLDSAVEELRQLGSYPAEKIYPGSELEKTLAARAEYEAARGNPADGIALYQELLDRLQPAKPGLQPDLTDAVHWSTIYAGAAALYRKSGRAETAGMLDEKRLDLWRQWESKLPHKGFVARQLASAASR